MTDLNFFQRYSQREDHITNNVLLMLRHIYRQSPLKLQTVLDNILDESSSPTVGVTFNQQTSGRDRKERGKSKSRPDGLIAQTGWEIRIEVKPGDHWNTDQLRRHAEGFNENATSKILLLLSTDEAAKPDICYEGVSFASVTFQQLLDAVETDEVAAAHEVELRDIIDDFREILASNDLLPNPFLLFAFNCAGTLEDNLKPPVYYYEPADRPTKRHVLNGFYANKRIAGIGRPDFTYKLDVDGSVYDVRSESRHIREDEVVAWNATYLSEPRFTQAMRVYVYGEDFADMSDEGLPSFTKDTAGGYQGGVWLNLAHWFEETISANAAAQDIANALDGMTFGKTRGF